MKKVLKEYCVTPAANRTLEKYREDVLQDENKKEERGGRGGGG